MIPANLVENAPPGSVTSAGCFLGTPPYGYTPTVASSTSELTALFSQDAGACVGVQYPQGVDFSTDSVLVFNVTASGGATAIYMVGSQVYVVMDNAVGYGTATGGQVETVMVVVPKALASAYVQPVVCTTSCTGYGCPP